MGYEMTVTGDQITYTYSSTGISTNDILWWNSNNWYQYEPYIEPPRYIPPYQQELGRVIEDHLYRDRSENQKEKELKGYIMKKLFNIYVIDDVGQFLMNRSVIAIDEEDARFEANVDEVIRKVGLKYKDVTVVCQLISGGIKIKDTDENIQLVKVVE